MISVVLLCLTAYLYKQNNKLTTKVNNANSNIVAYQGILSQRTDSNRVLKLAISDLSQQNDKLLQRYDSVRAAHKIDADNITTGSVQSTKIDTVFTNKVSVDTISGKCNFKQVITPNKLTSITVELINDSLTTKLDIHNNQYLFIYNKRQYKHKKNFIKRLFTLDFKRITVTQYQIVNDNKLIKIDDSRVFESTKDN